ncbi:hypothetical protein [Oceanobacter sp. 3_MG-2023]|uniref:hypothetical protein n=1 Tax=Oceanobacter sp. 3_MG-2023 TaxID=3062622 RepID=UPI002736A11A|nr:hypothetical protein [Oceanobacter sp. 3_MG-2023]MDP2505634.1 hypothetical protein [Oceanobacter sp. 3_MG-2023]
MTEIQSLTTEQIELVETLIYRQFERECIEGKMLAKELGQQSAAYRRTEKKAGKTLEVLGVFQRALSAARQLDQVRALSGVAV